MDLTAIKKPQRPMTKYSEDVVSTEQEREKVRQLPEWEWRSPMKFDPGMFTMRECKSNLLQGLVSNLEEGVDLQQ